MGWKNRQLEFIKKSNKVLGWKILNKYSLELKNLIETNKSNQNIFLILCQMNGKFYSDLKSNKLDFYKTKYNLLWKQSFNRMFKKCEDKSEIIFNTNQLVYISNKNIN